MPKPGAGSWVGLSDAAAGNEVVVTSGTVSLSGTVDTELPAAAALTDNTANPTVPAVGSFGLLWDGAAWDRAAGNTLGEFVQGGVAAGVADSGNPLKVGGVYNSTRPTYTTGQRGDAQLGSRGALGVQLMVADANGFIGSGSIGDAQANTANVLYASSRLQGYNGATFDMLRSDTTNGLDVDVTRLPRVAAATLTNVNDSAASVTLIASNAARVGAIVFNDSDQALFLKYGATASTTSFTYKILAGGTWEMPQPVFTGVVDGIWAADSTGAARVTEL